MPIRRPNHPVTRGLRSALSALLVLAGAGASGFEVPRDTTQCVLGIADGWNASAASLVLLEKQGGVWRQVGNPWQARLGKSGLAWGLGLQPVPVGAATKREGDLRSPAGVFYIGGVWGYARTIRKHPGWFYHRVNSRDLWIEDPQSESYNRHVMLDHEPATAWEKKQQMKQHDPAHSLKLFIAHNAPPKVKPWAGSSIFFHIWRDGGGRATAGCTAMAEARLKSLIAWLDPGRKPVYILLPKGEYDRLRPQWKLPSIRHPEPGGKRMRPDEELAAGRTGAEIAQLIISKSLGNARATGGPGILPET